MYCRINVRHSSEFRTLIIIFLESMKSEHMIKFALACISDSEWTDLLLKYIAMCFLHLRKHQKWILNLS